MVRGAGNDAAEAQRAVQWMKRVLLHPDWRPENLARIRDVVDQALSGLRNRMQGSEESWVNNPADAYWRQDNPLLLTTASFLTQAHNVHRLRWMLKDAGPPPNREAIAAFLSKLADAGAQAGRTELGTLLGALQAQGSAAEKVPAGLRPYADDFARLPREAGTLAVEAAEDLEQLLTDIPDATLAADWAYLCRQMRQDLLVPPEKALADLNAVRRRLLRTGNARMFPDRLARQPAKLQGGLRDLLAGLERAPVSAATHARTRSIDERLRARAPGSRRGAGLCRPDPPEQPERGLFELRSRCDL